MPDDMPAAGDIKTDEQKPKPKLPLKTILVILGVLVMEGGTIGIFMAVNDGPKPSEASNPIAGTSERANADMAEIQLVEPMTIDNYTQGRTRMLVTIEVSVKIEKSRQEKLSLLLTEHATEIKDRIRSLISAASPDNLKKDYKLQVIKREIKVIVEKTIGREDSIDEILIPSIQVMNVD